MTAEHHPAGQTPSRVCTDYFTKVDKLIEDLAETLRQIDRKVDDNAKAQQGQLEAIRTSLGGNDLHPRGLVERVGRLEEHYGKIESTMATMATKAEVEGVTTELTSWRAEIRGGMRVAKWAWGAFGATIVGAIVMGVQAVS